MSEEIKLKTLKRTEEKFEKKLERIVKIEYKLEKIDNMESTFQILERKLEKIDEI